MTKNAFVDDNNHKIMCAELVLMITFMFKYILMFHDSQRRSKGFKSSFDLQILA
jgi:hypothetical protein